MDSTATSASPGASKRLHLQDLPLEIQKEIFSQADDTDLVSLALVSHHFHDIASSLLYRTFQIIFGHPEDFKEASIDALSSGLDTFATSEYNYARHLRTIEMDTYEGGDRGERACRGYFYDSSCGKFMGTLFFLTVRRAAALETFYWNLRIELSRPIFKELHKLQTLTKLHVRLQAGPSIYERAPPLPLSKSSDISANSAGNNLPTSSTPVPPLMPPLPPPPMSQISLPSLTLTPPPPPPSTQPYTHKSTKSSVSGTGQIHNVDDPPTFSGFHHLSNLAVLDMDSLEYIPEVAACIRNCATTLKKLKLSISEARALKARKLPADDMDDLDHEVDDFGNGLAVPPPPPPPPPPTLPNIDPTLPLTSSDKEARLRAERKRQETILASLFGEDEETQAKQTAESKEIDEPKTAERKIKVPAEVLRTLEKFAKTLPTISSKPFKQALEQLQPDTESVEANPSGNTVSESGTVAPSSSGNAPGGSSKKVANSINIAGGDDTKLESVNSTQGNKIKEEDETSGLFGNHRSQTNSSGSHQEPQEPLDDINIEIPDVFEESEEESEHANDDDAEQLTAATESNATVLEHVPTAQSSSEAPMQGPSSQELKEYTRSTRKLELDHLSIYLIPLKASVLSRHVNLYYLKRICLLNVGPQAPFWSHLSTLNKETPLNLEGICSDNVTMQLLNLINELTMVIGLELLERASTKSRADSLAEKTNVTEQDIRRLALRKHMKTLTHLRMRNETDYSWDLSAKSVRVITDYGTNLIELGICLNLRMLHLLLQHLSPLRHLFSLHIISFHTDDTCHWVLREVRKFVMDTIVHDPRLSLQYIGVNDTVERLDRSEAFEKQCELFRKQGSDDAWGGLQEQPPPKPEKYYGDDDMSDDDDNDLKIESWENLKFHEISDVWLFGKDVIRGAL